jgi:hypothetical protein
MHLSARARAGLEELARQEVRTPGMVEELVDRADPSLFESC